MVSICGLKVSRVPTYSGNLLCMMTWLLDRFKTWVLCVNWYLVMTSCILVCDGFGMR